MAEQARESTASAIIDASPGNLNGQIPSPFKLQASLENVQEFRVESSNYPAEYGTGTGGQITVVTRSGGNDFHGDGFAEYQDKSLVATNPCDEFVRCTGAAKSAVPRS